MDKRVAESEIPMNVRRDFDLVRLVLPGTEFAETVWVGVSPQMPQFNESGGYMNPNLRILTIEVEDFGTQACRSRIRQAIGL